MTARIEHINITVPNPEEAARLMVRLFGWTVRWTGPTSGGGTTIHVGSQEQYIALCTGTGPARVTEPSPKGRPFNHIGVEVADLDEMERRVVGAGLTTYSHDDYEPGRRFYFKDRNGIEYELVSYK
jgi:catechol 2,3-dioxygenase-like lactoylglutathione lyase family enzyme